MREAPSIEGRAPGHPARDSVGRLLVALLLLTVAVGCAPQAPDPLATGEALAIQGAWLWDGRGSRGRADTTIVVREGRIAAVGPSSETTVPPAARVIDGGGLFVIPGLWDMHVHALWERGVPETFLPLFVVHGITGVRDMGGTLGVLAEARRALAAGEIVGPRLVAAGMIVDGPEPVHAEVSLAVETREDGRRAVQTLAAAGVDFVKVYTLLPAAGFEGVLAAAAERSLPVAGHVPASVGPIEAAAAGMASVEHGMSELGGFCGPDEPAACEPIFAAFRRYGTYQVPVLAIERKWSKEEMAGDPRLRYLPRVVLDYWFDGRLPIPSATTGVPGRAELPEEIWLTGALHEADLSILAGTDAGVPFSLPGWSLHDELELLVAAGLTPVEALTAATRGPAELLGRTADLGTVEAGKRADLVLLRADPLQEIRHTREIEAVVLDGELLDRAALDRLLAEVAAIVEGKLRLPESTDSATKESHDE